MLMGEASFGGEHLAILTSSPIYIHILSNLHFLEKS
jgi:hypothetical protein